jgi:hypothetical protein
LFFKVEIEHALDDCIYAPSQISSTKRKGMNWFSMFEPHRFAIIRVSEQLLRFFFQKLVGSIQDQTGLWSIQNMTVGLAACTNFEAHAAEMRQSKVVIRLRYGYTPKMQHWTAP